MPAMKGFTGATLLLLWLIFLWGCTGESDPGNSPGGPDSTLLKGYAALHGWLDTLKANPCFKEAGIGYLIVDISGQKPSVIAACNPDVPLIPASALKLLVTGAALEIFGQPVIPEIKIINEMSVNWRSSKMMRRIGKKVLGKENNREGARAVTEFWKAKGLDIRGMVLDDGNGLSRNNAISPKQLVDALTIMLRSPHALDFYESLPVAGYTGTLRKAMHHTAAQGRVRAKTGTIAGVKSFAGYVRTVSERQIIFALIINNYNCRTRDIKRKMETVMVRIAEI